MQERYKRYGFDPWVRKIPWRRTWEPTPVFLPEGSHGQRSLAGYSPQSCKGLDMTEATQQQHVTTWASQVVLVVKNPSANEET